MVGKGVLDVAVGDPRRGVEVVVLVEAPRRAGGLVGQVALGREALEVGHEAEPERVLDVHPLDGDEVAGDLCGALPETDAVVVDGDLVRVVGQGVESY